MSNQKSRNPDVDFGFHAQIPRIVRTSYRDLTPVQKWLYTCLKDLCGDHGTCYRTVKILAEETGISTGMISESIPVLHSHGLIHGEKKKRSGHGKEVWHITIVDIWQANARAYPTKRSQNEQTLAANVHTVNENVHRMNEISSERSQNEYKRSLCETEGLPKGITNTEGLPKEERAASPSPSVPHARFSQSDNENDSYRHEPTQHHEAWNCEAWCRAHDGTCDDYQAWIDSGGRDEPTAPKLPAVEAIASTPGRMEETPPASISTRQSPLEKSNPIIHTRNPYHGLDPLPFGYRTDLPDADPLNQAAWERALQAKQTTSTSSTDGAATVVEGSEPRASVERVTQESILADWDAVQGQPVPRDDRVRKAARELVRASPTREELAGCMEWLPKTDRPGKPWYSLHGVGLWDIAEKLGLYRHHLALSIEPAPLADMPKPKPMDIYTAASLDPERNSIERLIERQNKARLKREAAQQGGAN